MVTGVLSQRILGYFVVVALAAVGAAQVRADDLDLGEAFAGYRAAAVAKGDVEAATNALVQTARALGSRVFAAKPNEREALVAPAVPVAIRMLGTPSAAVRESALALLATCGGDNALSALDAELAAGDSGRLTALCKAVASCRTGETLAWFVSAAPGAWTATGVAPETVLGALVVSVSPLSDESGNEFDHARKARAAVERALRRGFLKRRSPEGLSVAVALARTAGAGARKPLAAWLSAVRNLPESDLQVVLEELGEAGDSAAVPLLLDYVKDTGGHLFETTLVALFACSTPALRVHARAVLGATIPLCGEEYLEARSLSGNPNRDAKQRARFELLRERGDAWSSSKLVDVPPAKMKVPAGVGVRGVTALWWKVVDALDGKLRAPKASDTAWPKFMNGRPNLQLWEWQNWWK